MDKLHHSLLLDILSRLDDSADVARCRVAWKPFNTIFPSLRSINLRCTFNWYFNSKPTTGSSSLSQDIKPFKTVCVQLISHLRVVESVRIEFERWYPGVPPIEVDEDNDLTDDDFVREWLPRISAQLKSLSLSNYMVQIDRRWSSILPLISNHCHNLVELKVKHAWLSVDNLNVMPMLTSLTLERIKLEDEHLNKLNNYFPNLQVLNLKGIKGLRNPTIHLLNLKTCHWFVVNNRASLTLITPNLITLKIDCLASSAVHVEAPILSHFHLHLTCMNDRPSEFTAIKFENLKTLKLRYGNIGALLLRFPVTKTVENLTLYSRYNGAQDSTFNLEKVFTIFPNVSSLCLNLNAMESEACLGWEILDGRKGLNSFCAYLKLVDPTLTFSCVACVLDQYIGLINVSLLTHSDVVEPVSKSFMSKCIARWPNLKWRWGIWHELDDDSWIIDGRISTTPQII